MSDLDARVAALKACPFCGNTPRLVDLAGFEVICDCGVVLCLEEPDQESVVAAWNRRAELQKPALHEPDAFAKAMKNPGVQELCNVLQGRAKPALHTNATIVPDGWKLLPIKPTAQMLRAMEKAWQESEDFVECEAEYRALVAAAPNPPAPEPAQEEITDATLKRYDMNYENGYMLPSKRGTWVRYADLRANKGEKT